MPKTTDSLQRTIERVPADRLQTLAGQVIERSGKIMAALIYSREQAHLATAILDAGDKVIAERDRHAVTRASLLALVELQMQGDTWLREHNSQYLAW
jgi:hypothetical protein